MRPAPSFEIRSFIDCARIAGLSSSVCMVKMRTAVLLR